MPRRCTVCDYADRDAIDAALVAGTSARQLAALYRVSDDAITRHRTSHLPETLVRAAEASEVARAEDLLTQVRSLQARALAILDQAEEAGDLKVALTAIREARGNLEMLAKLLGAIDDRPQINVLVSPEWIAVRSTILAALASFPEARVAVADHLTELERTS